MHKTLTKNDLVQAISKKTQDTMQTSKDHLETALEIIKECLANGEEVKISGFGKFRIQHKSNRNGRNPQTGETITIFSRKVVLFKSSMNLRCQVNTE